MQNDVTNCRFGVLLVVEFMAVEVLPNWMQDMGFSALGTAFFLTAFATAADVAISRDWVQPLGWPRWHQLIRHLAVSFWVSWLLLRGSAMAGGKKCSLKERA